MGMLEARSFWATPELNLFFSPSIIIIGDGYRFKRGNEDFEKKCRSGGM
jgi:hypothetical protein